MDTVIEKEMERLSEAVPVISEEIDLAAEDDATPEEIEKAKGLAAKLLADYDGLLKRLGPDDKINVQRTIGLKIAKIKGKLTQLPDAPEAT